MLKQTLEYKVEVALLPQLCFHLQEPPRPSQSGGQASPPRGRRRPVAPGRGVARGGLSSGIEHFGADLFSCIFQPVEVASTVLIVQYSAFQMSWFGSRPSPKGIIRPSVSGAFTHWS